MKKKSVYFLHTENYPIFDQLVLEEAFLRTSSDFLIWINEGSPKSIVLGISSKIEELVEIEESIKHAPELIRRYSGGGTVICDHNTIFVTLVFNTEVFSIDPFPAKIMQWSSQFYAPFMKDIGFDLKENDYVIQDKKFGGNAQYISKKRFVHHSTLLWDFDPNLMSCLKHPKKAPNYRSERHHQDFLTTLKQHFPSKKIFVENLVQMFKENFTLNFIRPDDLQKVVSQPTRQSTEKINLSNFLYSYPLNQKDQKMLV